MKQPGRKMISGKKAAPRAIFSPFVSFSHPLPPTPSPPMQAVGLVHVSPAVLPHLLSVR